MIFTYMVRDTIKSHMKPPNYSMPNLWRNDFHTQGLDPFHAKQHPLSSPWVTLNKQYCAEYLRAFVDDTELRVRFTCKWSRHFSASECADLGTPNDCLRLIANRFNIAGPYTGIQTTSAMLLLCIKGICFSYHYEGSYFERGFMRTERRKSPPRDFLTEPLRILRQYHEDCKIPSDKLSIHISYGEPGWNVLACLRVLDESFPPTPHRVVSLRPVQAQIQVNDYDASVATIDRELEVLKVAMGKLIQKPRVSFGDCGEILELEATTDRDMALLRRCHLRAIDQVTQFWKSPTDYTNQTLKDWTRKSLSNLAD